MWYIDDILPLLVHTLLLIIFVPLFLILGGPIFLVYYLFHLLPKYNAAPKRRPEPVDTSKVTFLNFYYETRDGTKLAVDLWLPEPAGAHAGDLLSQRKYPVMIVADRYYRSTRLWFPFNYLFRGLPVPLAENETFQAFLTSNLAVVSFDVRGSGASWGANKFVWWRPERDDYCEIVEWIKHQSFCNGKIGVFGVSYSGCAAMHVSLRQASNQHQEQFHKQPLHLQTKPERSIVACVSCYGFWDIFHDVAYPGGIRFFRFANAWSFITYNLDRNRGWRLNPLVWLALEGVTPVATNTVFSMKAMDKATSQIEGSAAPAAAVDDEGKDIEAGREIVDSKPSYGSVEKNAASSCDNDGPQFYLNVGELYAKNSSFWNFSGRHRRGIPASDRDQNWSPAHDFVVYADDKSKNGFDLVDISLQGTLNKLRFGEHLEEPCPQGTHTWDDSLLPDMLHLSGYYDSGCRAALRALYHLVGRRLVSALSSYLYVGVSTFMYSCIAHSCINQDTFELMYTYIEVR
jgi:hypothetical protein